MIEETKKILVKQLDNLQQSIICADENLIPIEECLECIIAMPNVKTDYYKSILKRLRDIKGNILVAKIGIEDLSKRTHKLLKLD